MSTLHTHLSNRRSFTILHTEASKGWGGQEKRIMRVLNGCREAGHRVLLACDRASRIWGAAQEQGFELFHRPHRSTIDPTAIMGYLSLIRKERVDIVHTHSSRDGWNAGLAGRLSRRKPLIVRTRHLAGKIANPFVYKKLSDITVTVGSYMGQRFIDEYGMSPQQLQTIMTGIDLEVFDPSKNFPDMRSSWGCEADDVVIMQVAVLRGKKGHKVLLRALDRLRTEGITGVKVVIVGDGPYRSAIEETISELTLEKMVHMTGQQADIPAYLSQADIFCLPSYEEALGTSILEAMAMGLPAVASNTGGIPELITAERGGLFPVEDDEACARELKSLILDRESLRKRGEAAQDFARSQGSVSRMVDQTLALYHRLMEQAGR